jgi:hypothetical protein
VRAGDIEAVVAAWSGVPVERLTEDEMSKLVRLVSAGQEVELSGLNVGWTVQGWLLGGLEAVGEGAVLLGVDNRDLPLA